MDCLGPLAWTAQDCALILEATISPDPDDLRRPGFRRPDLSAVEAGIKGLRIGVPRHAFEDDPDMDPEVQTSLALALGVLTDHGATLSTVRLQDFTTYGTVARQISWPEETAEYGAYLRDHPDHLTAIARARLLDGQSVAAPDYINALRRRDVLTAEVHALMETVDLLVLPSMKTPAQRIGYERSPMGAIDLSLARPFNLTGSPALSVCIGHSAAGLPLAAQIVGRPFQDDLVLRAGHVLDRAMGQRAKRPDFA
jgi:aspartyl-tRNA(Asn)/glutamyl-tRNA(Gln) amidotransferase subunit A